MKNVLSLLVLSLFVLSCGKDDKRGSQYPALNDNQKSQFGAFVTATENTVQAPLELKKGGIGELVQELKPNAARRQMVERMRVTRCDVQTNFNQSSSTSVPTGFQPGNASYYLTVGGTTCPATMNTQYKYSYMQSGIDASFNAKYTIVDAEFKKLNDVTGFDLNGSFKATASQNSYEGSGAINGNIESTTYGNVKVEVSLNMKGDKDKGESMLVITFKFPDYTAEIKMIGEGSQNNTKFETYLNGEKLDGNQAKQIRRMVGIL